MSGILAQAAALTAFIPGFGCEVKRPGQRVMTFSEDTPSGPNDYGTASLRSVAVKLIAANVKLDDCTITIKTPEHAASIIDGVLYALTPTEQSKSDRYIMVAHTPWDVIGRVIPAQVMATTNDSIDVSVLKVSAVYDPQLEVAIISAVWEFTPGRWRRVGDEAMIEMAARVMSETVQANLTTEALN